MPELLKWSHMAQGMDFVATFVARGQNMKKRIHKMFFYTLLMGVYGVFFSVESFYNFEGQPDAHGQLRYGRSISRQV